LEPGYFQVLFQMKVELLLNSVVARVQGLSMLLLSLSSAVARCLAQSGAALVAVMAFLTFSFTSCVQRETNTAAIEEWIRSVSLSGPKQASVVIRTGEIRYTSDGGQTWQVVPSAAVGDDCYFAKMIDHKRGWAANMRGQLFRTDSAGATWTQVTLKDITGVVQIEFVNENDGWIRELLSIWRTQDGGVTWREAISTITPGVRGQPSGMFAIDANTVVVSGTGGQVYLTKDGGETWKIETPLSGELDRIDFRDVWFVNREHGWLTGVQIIVGGESSRPVLFETTDGGDTWKEVIIDADVWPSAICFIGEEGWLAGHQRIVNGESVEMRGVLLNTKDAGKHWVPVQFASDEPALTNVRFADKTHGWLVGGNRLFRTEDGGNTWRPVLTLPAKN
jgi:photosystem II stability/assembly factor-like uncharacterized protein